MALTKETFTLGINHIEISPVTIDTVTTFTLGTAVDVPGAQSFSMGLTIESKDLKGDENTLDIWSKATDVTFSFESGLVDLDVYNAILGGTLTSSGTTPNQTQSFGYNLGVLDNYFQLAAKIDYTDKTSGIADIHLQIIKCKIDKFEFSGSTEEYGKISMSGKGIACKCTNANLTNNKALKITLHETATAISPIQSA